MNTLAVCVASFVVVAILAFLYVRSHADCNSLRVQVARAQGDIKALQTRLGGITDIEAEVAAEKQRLAEAKLAYEQYVSQDAIHRAQLVQEYEHAAQQYAELKKEISLLEENLEDISFGLYKPHFSFQTSEEYKDALQRLRDRERQVVRDGRAAVCGVQWTVGDSKADGKRMTKQYTKVMLRAFNGECDAALSNVSWNNITKMEARIRKSYDAINETGSTMRMSITREYLELRLDELRLTHEYEEKKYQEKEEQRRAREEMREQEKAEREMQKARDDAERSEAEYQKMLEKARQETMQATGAQLEELTARISSFEAKLDEARKKKERAIARAQLTKSGFVYVISNIGAFGEHVFKIGMTRRMEPMDRINELGDASVPFPYDLHAMMYSDNAPELEGALHQLFEDRRVNLVNPRREFYQNVNIEEIEGFVKKRGLSAQFIKVPEAKEYRESISIRAQRQTPSTLQKEPERFPAALFARASS